MKEVEEALAEWRAAERQIEEAGGRVTPAMEEDVAQAKRRYERLVADVPNAGAGDRAAASAMGTQTRPEPLEAAS